jgi:tetratricopeptide (TPR) repeat protein
MSSNRLQRAQFFADRGRHEEAIREYQAQLSETPENAVVHGLLAMRLADFKLFEPAAFHAREALRCGPNLGFAHFALASVLWKSGQPGSARSSMEAAIQFEPENPSYFLVLASILYDEGQPATALKAIESCLRLSPENVAALNLRSALLRIQGAHAFADFVADQALKIDPESSLAHVNRGLSLANQGENREAIDAYLEALRLDPNCVSAKSGIREIQSDRALTLGLTTLCLLSLVVFALAIYLQSESVAELTGVLSFIFAILVIHRLASHFMKRDW